MLPNQPRVNILRNGTRDGGKVILVPEDWYEFLRIASGKFLISAKRAYNDQGFELDSTLLLRDGDIVYIAEDEPFTKADNNTTNSTEVISRKATKSHDGRIIMLNIGGKYFSTFQSTLLKEPNSLLAKMLNAKLPNNQCSIDKSGAFFIDRNPTYFEFILEYLRCGKLVFKDSVTSQLVFNEAKFFGIDSLVENWNKVTSVGVSDDETFESAHNDHTSNTKEVKSSVEEFIRQNSMTNDNDVVPAKNKDSATLFAQQREIVVDKDCEASEEEQKEKETLTDCQIEDHVIGSYVAQFIADKLGSIQNKDCDTVEKQHEEAAVATGDSDVAKPKLQQLIFKKSEDCCTITNVNNDKIDANVPTKRAPDYVQDWFTTHNEKPSVTIPVEENPKLALERAVRMLNSNVYDLPISLSFLKAFAQKYCVGEISDEWSSFGQQLYEINADGKMISSPLHLLKVIDGPGITTEGAKIQESDDLWFAAAFGILWAYRINEVNNKTQNDKIIGNIKCFLLSLPKINLYVLRRSAKTLTSSLDYRRIVAAYDMYLSKASSNKKRGREELLRRLTIKAFRRGTSVAPLLHTASKIKSLSVIELLEYIFIDEMAEEVDQFFTSFEEIFSVNSYAPYAISMGLVRKSAFSGRSNPNLAFLLHALCAASGQNGSENAIAPTGCKVRQCIENAAFILHSVNNGSVLQMCIIPGDVDPAEVEELNRRLAKRLPGGEPRSKKAAEWFEYVNEEKNGEVPEDWLREAAVSWFGLPSEKKNTMGSVLSKWAKEYLGSDIELQKAAAHYLSGISFSSVDLV